MKKLILIFIVLVVTFGCDKNKDDDNCLEYRAASVTDVNAPTSGTVNEDINIEVFFIVINGCGNFNKFIEVENENSTTIEIQAKYEGCYCTDGIETRSVNYIFNMQTVGEYEFKFKSSDTEYITVNITIE